MNGVEFLVLLMVIFIGVQQFYPIDDLMLEAGFYHLSQKLKICNSAENNYFQTPSGLRCSSTCLLELETTCWSST